MGILIKDHGRDVYNGVYVESDTCRCVYYISALCLPYREGDIVFDTVGTSR